MVYGWFVTPIGWRLALMVWGYALVFFLITSGLKIATYRLLGHLVPSHVRHLARIESHIAAADAPARLAGAKLPLSKPIGADQTRKVQ